MLAVMVIWSEMTFFNKKPVLSLFALFLNSARLEYNYFAIEVCDYLRLRCLDFVAYLKVYFSFPAA